MTLQKSPQHPKWNCHYEAVPNGSSTVSLMTVDSKSSYTRPRNSSPYCIPPLPHNHLSPTTGVSRGRGACNISIHCHCIWATKSLQYSSSTWINSTTHCIWYLQPVKSPLHTELYMLPLHSTLQSINANKDIRCPMIQATHGSVQQLT